MRTTMAILSLWMLASCSTGPTLEPDAGGRDSATEEPDAGAPPAEEDAGTVITEEPVPIGSVWIATDGPIGGGDLIGARGDWALARIANRVVVTRDRGLTWSSSTLALDADERVVDAVGDATRILLATDRALHASTDGGATFVSITTTPALGEIFSMQEVGGTLYIVGRPTTPAGALPAAFRSTDDGSTLTMVRDDVGFFFVAEDVMLANTASGLLTQVRSTDGGASWDEVTGLTGLSARAGGIVDAGSALYQLRSQVQLFRSIDRGIEWSPLALPTEARLVELVPHGGAVLAIDASGLVYELRDDTVVARSELALRSSQALAIGDVLGLDGGVLLASPGDVLRYDPASPAVGWQHAPIVATSPIHMACVGRSLIVAHGSTVSRWSEAEAWSAPLEPSDGAPGLLGPILSERGTLYLARQASVLVSDDAGAHFDTATASALVASGGDDDGVGIAAFAHTGQALLAGMVGSITGHADSHGEPGIHYLLGGGVLASADDGMTWSELAAGMLDRETPLETGPAGIDALAATRRGHLVATVRHGSAYPYGALAFLRFDPAARRWEEVASAPRFPASEPESTRGQLPPLRLRSDGDRVFAYAGTFLFVSDDDGASWASIARPSALDDPALEDATRAPDPTRWPRINALLVRDGLIAVAGAGHVALSTDGGETFSITDEGLDGASVVGLAACGGVGLFAGVADRGVYRLVEAP